MYGICFIHGIYHVGKYLTTLTPSKANYPCKIFLGNATLTSSVGGGVVFGGVEGQHLEGVGFFSCGTASVCCVSVVCFDKL